MMNSNIEPLAREMAARICRREGMPEAEIGGWVELHWPCAAAMLEAGLMNESGNGSRAMISSAASRPIASGWKA